MSFHARWEDARRRVDAELAVLLQEQEPTLRAALAPALEGGKRFRPALLLLVHEAFGGKDPERAVRWAAAIELVHTAALVHDDLVDGDDERRGKPAVHAELRHALRERAARPDARTSAEGLAALAGDAALVEAVALLDGPEAHRALRDALRDVWRGAWHEALPAAGPGDVSIARLKTASLFRLAAELGAIAAGAGPEGVRTAQEYALHLGLAYQWADDAVDQPAGARTPGALRALAAHEASEARKAAQGFPRGPARDALLDAPGALLAAVLPPAEAAP